MAPDEMIIAVNGPTYTRYQFEVESNVIILIFKFICGI